MRQFCFLFLFLFSLACFSQDPININLYPNLTGNPIASDFAGLSFEKDCLNKGVFSPADTALFKLFRTCGIKSMRVGANAVDEVTLGPLPTDKHYTIKEIDNLFLFAEAAGCKIFMGLNLGGDNNPSLADTEASYVIQKYKSELFGFEVGNEPDLYATNGYRKPPPTYEVGDYEHEYNNYYKAIKHHNPTAVFTGPACSSHHKDWTEPFRKDMDTVISMLTQHYYVAKAIKTKNRDTINMMIDTLLMKEKLNNVSDVAASLVKCAGHIPFRMSETNSLYDGGQWGVSDAFASALWALSYMYQLAYDSCAGVNFHGGLDGPYTVFSKHNNIYSARPIVYGILAFQIGSKGKFISDSVTNNNINLDSYSVIDSSNNIYTTIINKDKLNNAVINLAVIDTGNNSYLSAEYVRLSSDSLGDTATVTLGGQVVDSLGGIPAYNWISSPVTSHSTQINIPAGSAVVLRFHSRIGSSINDYSKNNKHFLNLSPNPASEKVTVITDMTKHCIISIYNLQGQILLQQQMQQGKTDIDISELAKGVYIVRLNGNARVEVGRLIKE